MNDKDMIICFLCDVKMHNSCAIKRNCAESKNFKFICDLCLTEFPVKKLSYKDINSEENASNDGQYAKGNSTDKKLDELIAIIKTLQSEVNNLKCTNKNHCKNVAPFDKGTSVNKNPQMELRVLNDCNNSKQTYLNSLKINDNDNVKVQRSMTAAFVNKNENDGFTVVTKKRNKKKMNTIKSEVDNSTTLQGVAKMGELHVYRLRPDTTAEQLKNYLIERGSQNVYCDSLTSKYPKEYASFSGSKTECLVENLKPCSCYNFRIQCLGSDWLYFKSSTAIIPYFVMHMTRAVKFGDTSIIRKIISVRPALLETANKESKTPLIQSIENQNYQMVSFLVNIGANVNNSSLITQRTPLMVALYYSNLQITKFLIDKGADLKAVDCNQLTALHHAVDSNIFENVKFCLDYDFYVNAVDNKGWTPLLRSVILECDDDVIKLLLQNGTDLSIKDKRGLDFYKHLELNNKTVDSFIKNEPKTKVEDFNN
ncbi:hypothetical protein RN001_011503 [Aquatica leii]|uniref:Uncharacterized protein n=1 Tax=Aquatica leii TaxID=1421715 RepID=A0AAN7P4C2_9COLE|nr:hypothetical protein RN001_011503 [Aquatica leii]